MFGTFKADYDVHLSFTLYLRSLNALWIRMLQIEINLKSFQKETTAKRKTKVKLKRKQLGNKRKLSKLE